MPHQCLGCGRAFANGSMELLKGCPGCKGTRFFYTETVLDDDARAAKARQSGGDLRQVLEALAREDKLDARGLLNGKSMDDWMTLAGSAPSPATGPAVPSSATATAAPAAARATGDAPAGPSDGAVHHESAHEGTHEDGHEELDLPALEPEASAPGGSSGGARPVGTVQVHEPGSYTLDVERLMAASPIVIEKEGVYMIHLASAFEAPPAGARPARRKPGRA